MDIHERIKLIPKALNISNKTFCATIGIPEANFSNITTGKKDSGISILVKIKEKYPFVNGNWLLDGSEQMFIPNLKYEIPNIESMAAESKVVYQKLPIQKDVKLIETEREAYMETIKTLKDMIEFLKMENLRLRGESNKMIV
jgi:hypothetical protein